jgi:hypothetical protein
VSLRDFVGRLGGGLTALGAGCLLSVVVAWGLATASSQRTWPLWPYVLCGAILALGAALYAVAQGWIPGRKGQRRRKKPEKPPPPPLPPSPTGDLKIVRETDDRTLRIVLTNKAAQDSFSAEIISITDKRGRSLATFEEPWPVPWVDEPGGAPRPLNTNETARLNLTTMTYSEPWELRPRWWWRFQSPHGPQRVQCEDKRHVLVTAHITRAGSEEHISKRFDLSTDIDNRPVFTAAT